MASIRRPTYTREIPPHSQPCQLDGRKAVKWKGRGGQWQYGIVCKSNPARCIVRSNRYRLFFTDHENIARSERGYGDRAASEYRLRELVVTAERIHAGQLSPAAARPRLVLTELLDSWKRYIVANGAVPESARRAHQQARDVIAGVGAVRVSDLTPSAVLTWIEARKRANRHGRSGFGSTTAFAYLGSVKQFCRWCAVVERCEPVDHLAAVSRRRDPNGARRPRRALGPRELESLLKFTRRSDETVLGLTGPERHALYLFACSTGLRANELASLTRASFDLDANEVTISGQRAKNRRTETIPVPPEVMRVVKPLLARAGRGPVWPERTGNKRRVWWKWGADMLRHDLKAAGIAYRDGEGRQYDFHALRGQMATDLDRAGVSLVRAQKLMRHSTLDMTSKHYIRPERAELAVEVGKLKRGRR